jgi:hypothetical protein
MLYKEIMLLRYECHTRHTNTLCGRNEEVCVSEQEVHNNHYAFNVET